MPAPDDEIWTLCIKSTRDAQITIASSATVAQAKVAVLEALDESPTAYVRLICQGRLLTPDNVILRNILKSNIVHAVIVAQQQKGISTGVDSQGFAVRQDYSNNDDDELPVTDSIGFGQLQYNRAQISAIRTYFNEQVDSWALQNPQAAAAAMGTETDLVTRRQMLEQAWMQAQGPFSEFRLNVNTAAGSTSTTTNNTATSTSTLINRTLWSRNNNSIFRDNDNSILPITANTAAAAATTNDFRHASVGTDRDFMWGFLLGFFVGFLMLIWVWMPTVPHKQKLGILCGISFQITLNMLKGGGGGGNGDGDDTVLFGLNEN